MLEFFAGSGLVALGLRGVFSPVWSNDISREKESVYKANFDGGHFLLADIKTVRGESMPSAHLSWSSFPCQDLSLAGNMAGITASRSGLVWEWLRVLDEMPEKPRVLCLENVLGLMSSDGGRNYKSLHAALNKRGYVCGTVVIDAVEFVPQSRPRVFVIAVAKNVAIPPGLFGGGPCWLHNSAAAKLGQELQGWVWWTAARPRRRRATFESILEKDAAWDKDSVLRLIPERHMQKLNQREHAVVTGYRRTREGKQQLELRFDDVAGCLRTGTGGSSKQFVVKKDGGALHARLLTVRESARLMGAPDSFALPRTNAGYTAMGDAVVVPVAKFIGKTFLEKLTEVAYA